MQHAPQASLAQAAPRQRHQQGAECTDAAGLGGREEAAVQPAQHQHHQRHDGHQLARHLRAAEQGAGGALQGDVALALEVEHHAGCEGGEQHDHRHEHRGQQEARDDAGDEQRADRLLGQHAADDHQQAGRDHHAQHRAAGHRAGREGRSVAMARHLGHGHAREHRGRCNGHARDRREHRVGRHRGHAQATAHAAQQGLGHLEGVLAHVRYGHQQPHQNEQRDGGEDVVGHAVVGGEVEQAHGHLHVFAHEPDAREADADERHGDVHAQQHENHEGADQQPAECQFAHRATPAWRHSEGICSR